MFTVEQTIDVCEVWCCPALTTGGSAAAYAATSPVICCAISEGLSQSATFGDNANQPTMSYFYGLAPTAMTRFRFDGLNVRSEADKKPACWAMVCTTPDSPTPRSIPRSKPLIPRPRPRPRWPQVSRPSPRPDIWLNLTILFRAYERSGKSERERNCVRTFHKTLERKRSVEREAAERRAG